MLVLAKCFQRVGAEVTVACAESFEAPIKDAGLQFAELEITRNANTGVASRTSQPTEEADRLQAFLEATKKGALETLLLQNRHRQLDMLADPDRIREEIRVISASVNPDLFLVDQLSYPVSLALYCLQKPFITFCPGHPTYIPMGDQLFGVPYAWPREFSFPGKKLKELVHSAEKVGDSFTSQFNKIINEYDKNLPPISDAFRFTSDRAVLFNYPDFGNLHTGRSAPKKLFMGHCFEKESLDAQWQSLLTEGKNYFPKVLLSLGTFLSARDDVLRKIVTTLKKNLPGSLCIVSTGASDIKLRDMEDDRVILRDFLPQKALLNHIDLFIHHGGNNSFTESLYFSTPMIILPFSSDQFSIARDAQNAGIAECINPNDIQESDLLQKVEKVLGGKSAETVRQWSERSVEAGPSRAVEEICRID